jgi:hypothetical protein
MIRDPQLYKNIYIQCIVFGDALHAAGLEIHVLNKLSKPNLLTVILDRAGPPCCRAWSWLATAGHDSCSRSKRQSATLQKQKINQP